MRWLLIGIVWLYFLILLVGPILYMASQSFSEGVTAFWTELSRPEALHGFTLTAEITLIVLVLNLIFGTMTALVLARTEAAVKAANGWDPDRDTAAGEQCRGYGAAAVMRLPGRIRIARDRSR